MLRQYELVDRVLSYDPNADEALLNRAYVFSMQAHGSQKRASGDPYFSHPIEVAGILTDLHLDDETIATAILHDTIEDTVATPEQIEKTFGPNVARLVDGVTKLSKIEAQTENERAAENLRKFLLAMSGDIRVLLVKLADRLHNMRTLHHIPNADKRRRIARETMDIYAPLAERIGMYEFMKEMQTLAFRELEPDAYASITKRLEQLQDGGGDRISRIGSGIRMLLGRAGVNADVTGREKHPYSIWRKMAERHISFEQLSDIMAFRVIVADEAECYRALGIIHQKWPMVPGRFKDYISTPKRNGYRSLHTSVIHGEKARIEIQIRSAEMHAQAEYGLAAHWAYKQGNGQPDAQANWIRDLLEILEHAESAEEILEHTRMAMYQDRIFAFTPNGELIQLPKGATPVDFAYAVHTDLGDQAVGAKINSRVVPLRTPIENGDQVQILRSKAQEPQPGWLNFVVTGKARAAIRRFVRHKERDESIALGRKFYDEIVRRLPAQLGQEALAAALKRLNMADQDVLMEAIARGSISDAEVMEALMPGAGGGDVAGARPAPQQREAISIKGLTPGVAFTLAPCCNPVPGDRIVGLRRPDEAVEVHAIDCPTLADGVDADWVDLAWGDGSDGGTARLTVIVKNEPGSLGVMASILGAQQANIVNLALVHRDSSFHTFQLSIEVHDVTHLMRILAALRAADAISSAERA
ncbi:MULTISPECIES: RelA/SpoT family protein [Sphingomonadales]|uniref:GTP pyrophosphokinase rsh n=1 Tax=Edaphosphingomonas fennica TaxID=114404 RepID=A0A2T4I0B2_9SPHN|nr:MULTISPECIES: bifunctional (p)ppGpp synthetase/guanosine-3',5'-bis(diphosphate) 3'-pyrophosphohydrolase [Sphingomonas]AGH50069.1 (p)ppGpp synthetase I SpoT/RelA [Sphingomonas sp. MM-1]MDX3883069.1 bifunctional (p)ppGpp synthetase/guanosine-3',5'-bis(diphosphate) 3'-pyrophosphohydrolase [Sphingomonas sp.]PTD22142.1 bifunctional (p)ppGpp synthetase/guanosine-3',5'-bis(diphosphate) 3'-pyrophosphohydrolase [Sphingomonas fennica]